MSCMVGGRHGHTGNPRGKITYQKRRQAWKPFKQLDIRNFFFNCTYCITIQANNSVGLWARRAFDFGVVALALKHWWVVRMDLTFMNLSKYLPESLQKDVSDNCDFLDRTDSATLRSCVRGLLVWGIGWVFCFFFVPRTAEGKVWSKAGSAFWKLNRVLQCSDLVRKLRNKKKKPSLIATGHGTSCCAGAVGTFLAASSLVGSLTRRGQWVLLHKKAALAVIKVINTSPESGLASVMTATWFWMMSE